MPNSYIFINSSMYIPGGPGQPVPKIISIYLIFHKTVQYIFQEGLANLCLVGAAMTVQRARVEANLPKKRGAAAAGFDSAQRAFFAKVAHSSYK